MRDDTYVFRPFDFRPNDYYQRLSSLFVGGYGGVNDHNLIVDREFADKIFRNYNHIKHLYLSI